MGDFFVPAERVGPKIPEQKMKRTISKYLERIICRIFFWVLAAIKFISIKNGSIRNNQISLNPLWVENFLILSAGIFGSSEFKFLAELFSAKNFKKCQIMPIQLITIEK